MTTPLLFPRSQIPRPTFRDTVLTCGVEVEEARVMPWEADPWKEKWTPSILPLPLPLPLCEPRPLLDLEPKPKRTGCGATVHTRPSTRGPKTWVGNIEGVGSVTVELPDEYFTEEQRRMLGGGPRRDVCGCLTVGVGCCVCGNTLGVRKTLCVMHRHMLSPSSYTFLADSVSPPSSLRRKSPAPESEQQRRYQHGVPRTPTNRGNTFTSLEDRLSQARLTPTAEELEAPSRRVERRRVARNIIEAEFARATDAASSSIDGGLVLR